MISLETWPLLKWGPLQSLVFLEEGTPNFLIGQGNSKMDKQLLVQVVGEGVA